jgi:hypothetical protein
MAEDNKPELAAEPAKAPRLFVSYSWTNQAHIDWVMQLATDLRAYGVETVIDRWDLREGQDAHSFMEQSVRGDAIDKAILVCDRKYVDRANKREGGVGAESQVVTSSIYKDVEQTKFTAVVTESDDDGAPVLPNFLTSRIFIDFRNSEEYSERLQQLVRWVFDKPLYRKPDVGPRPEFINDQIDFEPIRFHGNSLQGHNSAGRRDLGRFLDEACRQKADFTVEMSTDEPNDETIYRGIKSLPPIISQIIGEFDNVLIERELSDVEIDLATEYFGRIVQNYEKGSTSWSGDVTKFFGQFICTAILSRALKFRRFNTAESILQSVLIKMSYGGVTAETIPLKSLNTYLKSLESRNERLKLRRLSLHSDIIKEICEIIKIDLFEYMQADLILYFRESDTKYSRFWWPDSLLYAADTHGPLPLFARALQPSFRDRLMPMIGVSDKNALEELIQKIDAQKLPRISWPSGFSTVDVKQLANLYAILDTY